MSATNSVYNHNTETWRRVPTIAQLSDIYDPAMQVCSWKRTIPNHIIPYLTGESAHRTLQIVEVVNSGSRANLIDLPAGEGAEELRDDVGLLAEILCELVDCPSVGVRYATVSNAMCPRWHVDRVPIRMLCTYTGPGTEWLEHQGIDQARLSDKEIINSSNQRAEIGEVVLLKGALWQGNNGFGAIHRSPPVSDKEGPRVLLTLDPLWPD